MTPVRGDDEKHASEGERNACDDRSRRRHLEGWDLSGDEPDTGKQDQQEADLGECDARLMAQRKHGTMVPIVLQRPRVSAPAPASGCRQDCSTHAALRQGFDPRCGTSVVPSSSCERGTGTDPLARRDPEPAPRACRTPSKTGGRTACTSLLHTYVVPFVRSTRESSDPSVMFFPDDPRHLQVDGEEAPELGNQARAGPEGFGRRERCTGDVLCGVVHRPLVSYSGMRCQPGRALAL